MKTLLLSLAAVAASITAAQASSPDAWKAQEARARAACAGASGLKGAKLSPSVLFSDTSGKTAFLVTGTWPQPRMRGRAASFLCLFDRRSGKAEAQEAQGWTAGR